MTVPTPPPPGRGPDSNALAGEARLAAEAVNAQQLQLMAAYVATDVASDVLTLEQWEVSRLGDLARLRRQLAAVAERAKTDVATSVSGQLADVAQTAAGGLDVQVTTIADELVQALTEMYDRTPGLLSGGARTIVSQAAANVRAGNLTRKQATAQAADRLVAQGIAPARDRAGRRWTAGAYTEMRTRTAVMDSARIGRETQGRRFGTPYVQVSDAIRECPMCRPWEGRILTTDGTDPDGVSQGELAVARAAGLGHPNCRHLWAPYFPGLSRRLTAEADPAGYQASQVQRRLERDVRDAKLRLQVADTIDPGGPTAQAARARVRAAQAAVRAQVAQSGQRRRPDRERIPAVSS